MKLVPYGKLLLNPAGFNCISEVFVCVGPDSWQLAQTKHTYRRLAVAVPPEIEPDQFRYPVVGMEILVIGGISERQLLRLALHLLKSGAAVVRVIDEDGALSVHRPEGSASAA